MSLDRSPSPSRGGGWSSPGLTTPTGEGVNGRARSPAGANGGHSVTWASAKANSAKVNGYPSYQSQNQGFFGRQYRSLSNGLPYFMHGGQEDRYAEKEKLGRGRSGGSRADLLTQIPRRIGLLLARRRRYAFLVLLSILAAVVWFIGRELHPVLEGLDIIADYNPALSYWFRRDSHLGGGSKFVVILAANQGGGVMEWKGAREWAIERDSVRNKKHYVSTWGYELEIVDMSTKKRYAHEWRESWEKVDVIRNAMKKYPKAEW